MLKIAAFAPIPSASENTAAAEKAGLRRRVRRAWRTLWLNIISCLRCMVTAFWRCS